MTEPEKLSPQEVSQAIQTATKPESLGWELLVVLISIAFGVVLWQTNAVSYLLDFTKEISILTSFVAGMFFTSIFTAAPSVVIIAELARHYSVFWLAFFGGLGALLGDYVIFRFVRDKVSDALIALLRRKSNERWRAIFRMGLFRWLTPFIGAVIIASPLPDELGLTVWGISKLPTKYFVPLSFSLNFLGILIVGLIAKATL